MIGKQIFNARGTVYPSFLALALALWLASPATAQAAGEVAQESEITADEGPVIPQLPADFLDLLGCGILARHLITAVRPEFDHQQETDEGHAQ